MRIPRVWITTTCNDGFHTYSYDGEGNIVSVDSGSTATYVYNALNQRVRTVVGSTITEFVFNASGQRVSVWNGSTKTQLRGQYYAGGKPVAFYVPSSSTSFQHQDWLGTERLRTTYNGGVEGTYTSLPFGDAQAVASGTDLDPNHYASLDSDSETATDHAEFRQYNSTQGRWMRPDPYSGSYNFSNPQSMNRYAYVLNNPLGAIDPKGLDCFYPGYYAPAPGQADGSPINAAGYAEDGGGVTVSDLGTVTTADCSDSINDGAGDYVDGTIVGGASGITFDGNSYSFTQVDPEGYSFAGGIDPDPPPVTAIEYAFGTSTPDDGGGGGDGGAPSNFSPTKFAINSLLESKLGGLPSCRGLDNAGDAIGVTGAAGVVITSVSIGAIVLSGGTATPVVIAVDAGFGAAWAAGNIMNTAAKHGIGCWQ
jgi:RHS repeat-associated protein